MSNLLNRDEFRNAVFQRDGHKCVICGMPAVDAHHIIDRSLFTCEDELGGYFLNNGASLCSEHHKLAENTELSCSEIRQAAKISEIILPKTLSLTEFVMDYDKWGNPLTKNGKRLKGYHFEERKKLFSPEILSLFEKSYDMIVDKYPRTYHFPFSPGTTSDDRIAKNVNKILTHPAIITEKLDGENTAETFAGVFARSRVAPTKNPWAQWLKQKWDMIKNDLRDFDLEICGENMYGEHSIVYSGLNEHFYVFGMRNTKHNIFLSWEETCYYAELFDFKTVPVLGMVQPGSTLADLENQINGYMSESSVLSDDSIWKTPKEGVVVRIVDEFPNDMFYNSVFKYVRAKHVKTDQFWAKNWRRVYLHEELLQFSHERLLKIYETQINNKIINI